MVEELGIKGTIKADNDTGAVVGVLSWGTIDKVYNEASITGANERVGGLVGEVKSNSTIKNSMNSGDINVQSEYVGGIIGKVNGFASGIKVEICINEGTVYGVQNVGGITGYAPMPFGAPSIVTSNSMNFGKISSLRGTSYALHENGGSGQIVNSYYLKESGKAKEGVEKETVFFNSGEAAYILNNNKDNGFFKQDLSEGSSLPKLYGKDVILEDGVYKNPVEKPVLPEEKPIIPEEKPQEKPILPPSIPDKEETHKYEKLSGKDRYETANKIFDTIESPKIAVLLNGKSISDGLSASSLASKENGGILLVKEKDIPKSTKERIKKVEKVYIVGGENAIGKNVEDLLEKEKVEVERIAGKDRYETNE